MYEIFDNYMFLLSFLFSTVDLNIKVDIKSG